MPKSKQTKTVRDAFVRRARREPLVTTFARTESVVHELLDCGLSLEDATAELSKWVLPLVAKAGPRDVVMATMTRGAQPGTNAVMLLCVLPSAFEAAVRVQQEVAVETLLALALQHTADERLPLELRCLAAQRVLEVSDRASMRLLHVELMQRFGVFLTHHRTPAHIDAGLSELQRAAQRARVLVADGVAGSEQTLGRCLYNLAHTYRERDYGDHRADLERAIELFEECLLVPHRITDIGAYVLTVQSRTASVNSWVQILEAPIEGIPILTAAVEQARLALARLSAVGMTEKSRSGYNLDYHEEALWLAWANAKRTLLNLETSAGVERTSEIREHSELAVRRLGEFKHLEPRAVWTARKAFRSHLGQDSELSIHEFRSLLEEFQSLKGCVTQSDGGRLELILADAPHAALESDDIEAISALFDRVDPIMTGVALSRRLFVAEAHLLTQAFEAKRGAVDDFMGVIITSFQRALASARRHEYALAHRQVLGLRASLLTALFEDHAGGNGGDELVLFDLRNAVAFQADLDFFGHHARRSGSDRDAWSQLYWTRVAYDRAAFIGLLDEVAELHPEMAIPMQAIRAREEVVGNTDSDYLEWQKIESHKAEMDEVRMELVARAHVLDFAPLAAGGSDDYWPFADRTTGAVLVVEDDAVTLHHCNAQGDRCRVDLLAAAKLNAEAFGEAVRNVGSSFQGFIYGSTSSDRFAELLEDAASYEELVSQLNSRRFTAQRDAEGQTTLDRALDALLETLALVAGEIVSIGTAAGFGRLAILSNGAPALCPWEVVSTSHGALGGVLEVVHIPTLAAVAARSSPSKSTTLAYVGSHNGGDAELLPGGMVMESAGLSVKSGFTRDRFEMEAEDAKVIRLFTHAHWAEGPLSSSFSLGGVEEARSDGKASTMVPWISAGEVKALDLRGCARVELWACESGQSTDLIGYLLGVHEPGGLAAAFLLAGADRVLGSWWPQPIGPASLICLFFQQAVGEQGDVFDDAAALAKAVSAYRDAVAPGSVFESAVLEFLRGADHKGLSGSELQLCATSAGWSAVVRTFTQETGIAQEVGSELLGGFDEESVEERELREVLSDPNAAVQAWMQAWRGPTAWAGWRVIGRDRHSLQGG